jgi:hypothetical protein
MSQQQDIAVVIVIGLIGLSLPCLGGTTRYTERSVEELKLMTTPELAGDARLICHDIVISLECTQKYSAGKFYDHAIKTCEQAIRGRRYLERVGFVVLDRHGGQMPVWFDAVSASKNQPDCDPAATAGGWRPKQ